MIAALEGKLRAVRDSMTPGQRWTAALALAFATSVIAFGLPHRQMFRSLAQPATLPQVAAPAPPEAVAIPDDPAPGPAGSFEGLFGPAPSSEDPGTQQALTERVGPAYRPVAEPGVNGSCDLKTRSVDNPRHPEGGEPMPVWVFEPTGAGPASLTGGSCSDARRPAVLVAHGFGQTDPAAYEALIEHLVSVGNVVVYPTYEVNDGERSTLEESYRVVDAGLVAAVEETPRIDITRVGWWGHSHGGGMVPYLVQQGTARGWGEEAAWMSIVAQAFTQLVGAAEIGVPPHVQAMSVAFQHDAMADARLGIDVFESLQLPAHQKHHVTLTSDAGAQPSFVAHHDAPTGTADEADAMDAVLWRYADLLQSCAMHTVGCHADLTFTGVTDDGRPIAPAVVSQEPVDVGPYPAILAECDAGFGPTLNPRIERCGETRVAI